MTTLLQHDHSHPDICTEIEEMEEPDQDHLVSPKTSLKASSFFDSSGA